MGLNELIADIIGLGVPGLLTGYTMKLSGCHGAPAFNTAMKSLGKGNMYRGMAFMAGIGLLAQNMTERVLNDIARKVAKELYRQGETKDQIMDKFSSVWFSEELKVRIEHELDMMEERGRIAAVK